MTEIAKPEPTGSATHEEHEMLTLKQAVAEFPFSMATLNRHISAGRIPAVKMRGRNYVSRADVAAVLGPTPVFPKQAGAAEESLRAWAERVAAAAPPLRPEQRKVIISAFSSALMNTPQPAAGPGPGESPMKLSRTAD